MLENLLGIDGPKSSKCLKTQILLKCRVGIKQICLSFLNKKERKKRCQKVDLKQKISHFERRYDKVFSLVKFIFLRPLFWPSKTLVIGMDQALNVSRAMAQYSFLNKLLCA